MAGGVAAYTAVVQAIKASGVIVRLEPEAFLKILKKDSLVVTATGGFIGTNYQYLTGYKGLAFYTKSPKPLNLPDVEVIIAKSIWIPG